MTAEQQGRFWWLRVRASDRHVSPFPPGWLDAAKAEVRKVRRENLRKRRGRHRARKAARS